MWVLKASYAASFLEEMQVLLEICNFPTSELDSWATLETKFQFYLQFY